MDNIGRLERRIVVHLASSTKYLAEVSDVLDPSVMKNTSAAYLASWCIDFYRQFKKAPRKDIRELIKEHEGNLQPDVMKEIKTIVYKGRDFKEAFKRGEKFNLAYLVRQTFDYCRQRRLDLHREEVDQLVEDGDTEKAERLMSTFTPFSDDKENRFVDIGSDESIRRLREAFDKERRNLIRFPGALGRMWNNQFVRGAFIALQGPEKRGKTFFLMEIAIRALRQNRSVAFFEVGDSEEPEMLMRFAARLSGRPVMSEDGTDGQAMINMPVRDCFLNQTGECKRSEREGTRDLGVKTVGDLNFDLFQERLKSKKYKRYKPCRNCEIYQSRGSHYYERKRVPLLDAAAAERAFSAFQAKHKMTLRLSTYRDGEVSVADLVDILNGYEEKDNFAPDVIIIDYADLLSSSKSKDDYRHRVNEVWKALRALSQARKCLVLTATQADVRAHNQKRLYISNFSEDKRKYAHVTAMYGLNQDPGGEEKKMGIMRVNQLVVRDGAFSPYNEVIVTHNFAVARAIISSYRRGRSEE